ncbi:MAG: tRNA 2-thiouridine(34) synthase MnmA [Solirubrobacteraceae bacterium]|nr:tRNA 2-thiouridine(34) synthase MnmA [Solirubrobacteraceae bacterium]
MADERFEEHLRHPRGRGIAGAAPGAHAASAGSVACGDLVRLAVAVDGDRVTSARFEAAGCGATIAAASAAVELAEGASLLDVARIDAAAVAAALGGLTPGKLHAADLAADALARALGGAATAGAALAPRADRVLVAMSGGVDSAVAALIAGRDAQAIAVTLELWRDEHNDAERSCCSASAVLAARSLAHGLGLPHLTLDLRDAFRAGVVEPWVADHARGLTPNPCVRCNGAVRIDGMLELAARLGAARLATGHYARISADGLLRAAADPAKDQSYVLAALSPEKIARLRFPLGELTKPEVRAIAARAGLAVADKPDSQDLCFLAGTGREAFLARHGGPRERPGAIVDERGRRIGRHRGAHAYTVGQRRGLGIGGTDEPRYVRATDVSTNTVAVAPREALVADTVRLTDLRLHRPADEVELVQLRYRARPLPCVLRGELLELREPAWAVAPGQVAVLRSGDRVVGCATIAR